MKILLVAFMLVVFAALGYWMKPFGSSPKGLGFNESSDPKVDHVNEGQVATPTSISKSLIAAGLETSSSKGYSSNKNSGALSIKDQYDYQGRDSSSRQKRDGFSGNNDRSNDEYAKSQEELRSTDVARQFLLAAYDVVRVDNPQLASEIREELKTLPRDDLGKSQYLNETLPVGGGVSDTTRSLSDETQEADEDQAESDQDVFNEEQESEDPWCGADRIPASPGTFRCPCPSDPHYFSEWRTVYNENFLKNMGCI